MENEWRKVKTSFSSPSFWQIEEKVFTLQRKFEISLKSATYRV